MPLTVTPVPIIVSDATMAAQLESDGWTCTPPAPPASALVGNWNNGVSIGVPTQIVADYADGANSTTYTYSPQRSAQQKGKQLSLAVGALTSAQAAAIGATLVANGQAGAIIRPMWEMNQHGWFDVWNQSAMTANQYVTIWLTLVAGFRSVKGQAFKFFWCATADINGQNNAPGRSDFDTFPGTAYCDYVGLDCYDNNGSVAQSQTCINQFVTFAKSAGLPWMLGETGPANAVDDPAFITMLSTLSKNGTCAGVVFFSQAGLKSGAGTDFQYSPNMLKAIATDFA